MHELTQRQLQFLILEIAQTYPNGRVNRFNLLGKPQHPGDLERRLSREFSPEERTLGSRAFQALLEADLLQTEWADLANPMHWAAITQLGVDALKNRALDDLDKALIKISPKLVELRDGMWAALASNRTNAVQQAAHSARELIDQTLKTGAPDQSDRRARAKHILATFTLSVSTKEQDLIDATIELVLTVADRLPGAAHARIELEHRKVKDLLIITELALKRLLLP